MMMMMMVMGKGGRWGSRARKTLKPRERESSQPQSKPALCISPFLFFSLFGLNLGVAGNSRLVVEVLPFALLCFGQTPNPTRLLHFRLSPPHPFTILLVVFLPPSFFAPVLHAPPSPCHSPAESNSTDFLYYFLNVLLCHF